MADRSPYRIRLVEPPQAFAMGCMDLWILQRSFDREVVLRAPDGSGGGIWTPAPDPGTVWDIPPTLQLPTDALPDLRAELDRVLAGRPLNSAEVQAARADALSEALQVERARVDRLLEAALGRIEEG